MLAEITSLNKSMRATEVKYKPHMSENNDWVGPLHQTADFIFLVVILEE